MIVWQSFETEVFYTTINVLKLISIINLKPIILTSTDKNLNSVYVVVI